VAGFYLDPHRAVLLLTSRPTPAGRAAPPAPTGPGADPDVLAAVASVLRAAGRPGQPAPRSLANSLAGEASAFDGFLGATRRRHPGASLHAVVLRQSPGDDAHLLGRCERAGVTLHQLPERTTDGAFARAVLALDAARHPESSARVLLDLASALGRYASAPGPSPAPVRWVREPLLTHLGEHNNQGTGRRRPATAGGANQIDLGSFNECVVIETVRLAGSISRGEISERSRLTQQSVSRIVRSLIQRGLLVEDRQRTPAVGKPRSRVRLRDDAAHALGIHVDPEVLTAVLVNLSGRIVARRAERITSDARPGAVVDQIAGLGESVLAQAGRAVGEESFLGVGVATPGPVDTVSGTVLDPPLMSVLRDVPLRSLLERRFACPIVIEKDSSAAAVGERWIGRDHRTRDFVYLYLGTGVGAGLVLNGDIHRGLSANAGEFGQLCAVALGRLDAEGRPEILPECNPAVHLAEPPRPAFGHGTAPTVRQAARAIGRGALAMVDLLDVGLVVVGGPFFTGDAAEIYLTEIERAVNAYPTARRLRRVHVERSVNSSETVAVGAASTIFHATFTPRLRHTAP
jgi:predicted NBD/HSP70 family sugar kinase